MTQYYKVTQDLEQTPLEKIVGEYVGQIEGKRTYVLPNGELYCYNKNNKVEYLVVRNKANYDIIIDADI